VLHFVLESACKCCLVMQASNFTIKSVYSFGGDTTYTLYNE